MKKLSVSLLIIGVLSSYAYSKQIASCKSDGLINDLEYCFIFTNSGHKEITNIKTLGGMYSRGWRLITVATHSWMKSNRPYSHYAGNTYFYFEK